MNIADEIRKCSLRSIELTKEIDDLIERNQSRRKAMLVALRFVMLMLAVMVAIHIAIH